MGRNSKSRYAILGILSLGPSSGYDIKKFTENNLSHFWSESYGNLYTLLKRLLDQGRVTRRTESREGKPDRIVYSITEEGRKEFEEWLGRPFEQETIRSELLLKLFFGSHLPREQVVGHLVAYRRQQQGVEAALAGVEGALEEQKEDPNFPFWKMTLRRGRLLCQARIRWVDESLDLINGGNSSPGRRDPADKD